MVANEQNNLNNEIMDSQTSSGSSSNEMNKQCGEKEKQNSYLNEQSYDCCICRLSSHSSVERPMCIITLLQATNVLGHRESERSKCPIKRLQVTDPAANNDNSKQLDSTTKCLRQEAKRIRCLRQTFNLDSCRYSVNLGWTGGSYAQMCGHYLHYDCFLTYKQTIEVRINHDFLIRSNKKKSKFES